MLVFTGIVSLCKAARLISRAKIEVLVISCLQTMVGVRMIGQLRLVRHLCLQPYFA